MSVGAWQALLLIMRRDLRLSFRRPDQLLQPLVFFLIVTTLFPLGLSLQLSLLRDMAPGVLWVAALLSSLLSLDVAVQERCGRWNFGAVGAVWSGLTRDRHRQDAGALAGERSGAGAGVAAGGHGARHSDARHSRPCCSSLALGTLTLSWLGAIGAGLTVGLRRGNVLLSLIVLPLAMPLLIFGAGATDRAISGTSPAGALYFLAVAVRVHVYAGALRRDGRAAHHARMNGGDD